MKLNIPKKTKEFVKERDGNKCIKCDSKKDLELHHIIPTTQALNHTPKNLITLCKKCHHKLGISNWTLKSKYKNLNETFTDSEIKVLTKEKNGLSWHDWIMMMAQHCNEAVKKGDLKIFRINKT